MCVYIDLLVVPNSLSHVTYIDTLWFCKISDITHANHIIIQCVFYLNFSKLFRV